jgi:choline dehydrogenase-like flavoprotein
MKQCSYDVVIVGSGAGGGTIAQELSSLCASGARIAVLEKGPKFCDAEFTANELEMSQALYEDGGAFLTVEKTMTLAFASAYGGSTVVYTGTTLLPSERVLSRWNVPGITVAEIGKRATKFMAQNNVHLVEDRFINDNNQLFVKGCRQLGYRPEQFPINTRDCRGSSLCNLGCPNQAKQGTHRVQLPQAERNGVEVVTRCEVLRIDDRNLSVRVSPKPEGAKGEPSPWAPGEYQIDARVVVVCAGAVNSPALLLRSGLGHRLPRIGRGFTCHPAMIMVGQHGGSITNFVGHPKSFYLDEFAATDRFVLETCMYFPLVTAKSMSGFGEDHSTFMQSFSALQMILVLACDDADSHNRVTIDRKGKAQVHYRFTQPVIHGLTQGAITSARIFFAAGALRAHMPMAMQTTIQASESHRLAELASEKNFLPGKITVSAAHLQGGCAMGRGAHDSVTDSYGRVHGIPWLFVADASRFPTCLEINPYQTIMALADRTAEHIASESRSLF